MKPLITTLLLLTAIFSFAQKAPVFGKIDKADLKAKNVLTKKMHLLNACMITVK